MPVEAGLVVVDKPGGLTSHAIVDRVRRLAGTRKVGHAGTLDPMATGVLVVGIGRATRLLGHLMLTEKTYEATVRLGATTTTDDAEGELVTTSPTGGLDEAVVREAFAGFVGTIDQVPAAVSAIKVAGKRAYQRVREGEQVALPGRRVTVHELVVREIRGDEVDLFVRCSSGTYIRSIARDAGARLAVGGHLTALRRTAVGPFDLSGARTLDQLDERLDVVPIAAAARAAFPAVDLDERRTIDVRHGRPLDTTLPVAGPVAVFSPAGDFLALYERAGTRARAVAVFTG